MKDWIIKSRLLAEIIFLTKFLIVQSNFVWLYFQMNDDIRSIYWFYGLNAFRIFQFLISDDFVTFLNISIKPGLQVDTIFSYLILLFMLVLQFSKWKKKHCASMNQSWTNGRWKEFLFVRISVKYPKITYVNS